MGRLGLIVREANAASCPGRGAAFFTVHRRAGTVTNAGAWYGPGSAAHHVVKNDALRPGNARSPHHHVFDLDIFFHAVMRAFAAEPRFLDAAEWRHFGGDQPGVDADHP